MRKWAAQTAALLRACADPTRLRLLNLLAQEGEVCVCHLVDVMRTNQPKVSRHLAYLKRAGLVKDRKDGLWVHYRLSPSLSEHASRLIACLNACAAEMPEMQQDVHTLRRIRSIQPLVRLARRPRPVIAEAEPRDAEPRAQEHPPARYEQEIPVELL